MNVATGGKKLTSMSLMFWQTEGHSTHRGEIKNDSELREKKKREKIGGKKDLKVELLDNQKTDLDN